jgi:hypothetical protein
VEVELTSAGSAVDLESHALSEQGTPYVWVNIYDLPGYYLKFDLVLRDF